MGGCPVMTREPGNLTAVNCRRFSGLAQDKTVDLSLNKKNKVVMTLKAQGRKKQRCPKASKFQRALEANIALGEKQIDKIMIRDNYRKDLARIAKFRFTQLRKSLRKNRDSRLKK